MVCSKCEIDQSEESYLYPRGYREKICRSCKSSLYKVINKARVMTETPEERRLRLDNLALRNRPWTAHKQDKCRRCGFSPSYSCQLTVDHIDGNKKNSNPSNFQTLCHNCHNLKTYI